MHLTITSTVKNAPHSVERCIRSVQGQSHQDFTHILFCVDEVTRFSALRAVDDNPRFEVRHSFAPLLANLLPLWRSLPPDEPIVWLDGDDWLAVPHALSVVNKRHEAGYWLTYGSFLLPDGSPGFSAPAGNNPRRERWGASHLKTFRAGLVQAMRDEDFREEDGSYAGLVPDLRVMFGCLELCPIQRQTFVSHTLVVYNVETSFALNASPDELARQEYEEKRVRAMKPYDRLPVDAWTKSAEQPIVAP